MEVREVGVEVAVWVWESEEVRGVYLPTPAGVAWGAYQGGVEVKGDP